MPSRIGMVVDVKLRQRLLKLSFILFDRELFVKVLMVELLELIFIFKSF
jgi:hypothetical protein